MEIYVTQQAMAFVWAVLMGGAFGLLFDVFRILRIALPFADVIIAAQDILFFSICAIAAFFYLLGHADGRVRLFLLLGILLGAVIYFCTLSIPIMGVSRLIIAFVKSVLSFFWRYFLLPLFRIFCWILSIILFPVRLLIKIFKKGGLKLKFSLKKWRILVYNNFTRLSKSKITKKSREYNGDLGYTEVKSTRGATQKHTRKGPRIWRRRKRRKKS